VSLLNAWIEQRKLTDPEAVVFPASSLISAFRDARACWDHRPAPARYAPRCGNTLYEEYKDVALLQQFLGDCDINSAMRYVNIDGKEASRLMRKHGAG
jgi:hypothetical protein